MAFTNSQLSLIRTLTTIRAAELPETASDDDRIGQKDVRYRRELEELAAEATRQSREQTTYDVEVTDLFGGEANYSWVNRYTFTAADDASTAQLIRKAKREAAWQCRHRSTDTGSYVEVRPYGLQQVMFIRARGY